MPKVSVVIPTRNRADLIGRAVESALAQTDGDLEVLIVDDASEDGTRDVIAGIEDARVKYFRHDVCLGVSAARNTAIGHAAGEFVAFLDDDDEWLPEKLRLQLDCFAQASRSVGLVCAGHHEVDRASNRITAEAIPVDRGWIFERLLRQGRFNHTSTILVRTECFARVGLFDLTYHYSEDFDLWLRIAREYECEFVEMPLARVYAQPDGLSQNYDAIIAGTHAHLVKYREFYDNNPAVFKERLQMLGSCYCIVGDAKRGRQMYYQAIARRPLAVKSYFGAALSLMGSPAFRFCLAAGIWTAARRLLGGWR